MINSSVRLYNDCPWSGLPQFCVSESRERVRWLGNARKGRPHMLEGCTVAVVVVLSYLVYRIHVDVYFIWSFESVLLSK